MTDHLKNTTHSELIAGNFRDRASAEDAYNSLTSRGYSKDDINVMMSDDTRQRHFKETVMTSDLGNKAAAGGLTGATLGGTVGAVAGILAVAGTLAIPGLGIVLAGPMAAGLAGFGAGAAAGGLLGALIGAGISEDRAKVYKSEIDNGGILVGVTPRSADDAAHFRKAWSR